MRKSNHSIIEKSAVRIGDMFDEVISGLFARPGRTIMTILGVVIGICSLVATIGLSQTAGNRIIGRFDELAATEIFVTTKSDSEVIPWDSPDRLKRLNGVVSTGTLTNVDIGMSLIKSSLVNDPLKMSNFQITVLAASPGLFTTVHSKLLNGRFFDKGHSIRGDRVAVIGRNTASKLNITSVNQLPGIMIGDYIYLVIGIIDSVERQSNLLSSIIIPEGTAKMYFNMRSPRGLLIETNIGAAQLIGNQVPRALRPDNPSVLKIATPNEPQRVKDDVQNDLNFLFIMLGAVSLLVGSIGIANVTLVSVVERTGEIGLRRANGATELHIALQFLLESCVIGVLGGVLGASLGTFVIIIVSFIQNWTPVLNPYISIISPIIGGFIGIISGVYPSVRAARMEPVDALRSGT